MKWYFLKAKDHTCSKLDSEPPGEGHDGVVVDVEERHLTILLAEHKEHLQEEEMREEVFKHCCMGYKS